VDIARIKKEEGLQMDNANIVDLFLNPQAFIILAVLMLGFLFKKIKQIPDKWIPLLLIISGAIMGFLIVARTVDGTLAGIVYAFTAIVGHVGYKQYKKDGTITPVPFSIENLLKLILGGLSTNPAENKTVEAKISVTSPTDTSNPTAIPEKTIDTTLTVTQSTDTPKS
jgi:hypothetical protein